MIILYIILILICAVIVYYFNSMVVCLVAGLIYGIIELVKYLYKKIKNFNN